MRDSKQLGLGLETFIHCAVCAFLLKKEYTGSVA